MRISFKRTLGLLTLSSLVFSAAASRPGKTLVTSLVALGFDSSLYNAVDPGAALPGTLSGIMGDF